MASVALIFDQVIYPFLWLLFFSWAYWLVRSLRFSPVQGALGLCAVILVATVFTTIHSELRIFADEVNLMASSQALYLFGRAAYVDQGIWQSGTLTVLSSAIDPRPLFFPFLVHLTHLIRGYSVANVFLVNALSLFMLLLTVGEVLLRRFGIWTALTGEFLILSQPIVLLGVTSGGFELFSGAILILILVLADSFLSKPSVVRFNALFYSGLVLAHSRYEGIIYLVIIFGALLFWCDFRKMFLRPVRIAIASIALLPVVVQRVITINQPPWVLRSGMFSIRNLIENNLSFGQSLLNISDFPFDPILNLVGFGVIVFGTVANLRTNRTKSRGILPVVLLSFWGAWIMVTAYAPSDIFNPVVQRYFITFSIFFALAAFYPLICFLAKKRRSIWALPLSAFLFVSSLSATKSFDRRQVGIFAQRFYYVQDFLSAREPGKGDQPILIGEVARQYLILGYSAITKDTFNRLLHEHKIPKGRKIYLIENEIKGRQVGSEIVGAVKRELIAEQVLATREEPGATKVKIYRIDPYT